MRRLLMVTVIFVLFAVNANVAKAGECDEHSWIPQTEQCLWFGIKSRLDILQRGMDLAFARAHLPAFYKLVLLRKGGAGESLGSYISEQGPPDMKREWFANFFAYVTLDYLGERDQYASLIRAGTQRFCEAQYLHYPLPLPATLRARRDNVEQCVYETMLITYDEQHYFSALAKEIELGDEYLAQFKGMPYTLLRDTVRSRFGPSTNH